MRELDALSKEATPAQPVPLHVKTLGGLFDAWRYSEEWKSLKVQTRSTYERIICAERGALAAVRARALEEFTPPFVIKLRDAVCKRRKRWMANYAVKVLRTAFGWGRIHGWCDANPARGCPLLPRPSDAPPRNRVWSSEEFGLVCERASPQLRRAIMLAQYAGMRIGDIVTVEWSSWDGEYLEFSQSKTGRLVQVRAPRPLREELNSGARDGTRILLNARGQPYTRDGLQTNLWKLVKLLVAERRVQPGLCFHGLRHSLGAALYDLGLDREARKAALGHTSDAASMVYERGQVIDVQPPTGPLQRSMLTSLILWTRQRTPNEPIANEICLTV